MWQLVKCVLRALQHCKRGFELMTLDEMCIEGVAVVEQGVSRWWQWVRGWLQWVKCVFAAWRQLKRGFVTVALREMCFASMGAVEKGVGPGGTG